MDAEFLSHQSIAEHALRAKGERVTQPRVAVLCVLMAASHAVSHLDVAEQLRSYKPVDRVTVYRVLEWLTQLGLAHRIACEDRVWRFMHNAPLNASLTTNPRHNAHEHAHFTCNKCGQMSCVETLPTSIPVQLPAGFVASEIDLMIRGVCATCAGTEN